MADEMQDTDSRQIDLLRRCFDETVVIQRIGDMNQAVFGFDATGDNELPWEIEEGTPTLEITGSKRFSQAIASLIAPMGVVPQELTGNPDVPNIEPTIIAFDDQYVQQVIPRFGDLIIDNQLQQQSRCCFKAIGWIGKPNPRGLR